MSPLRTKNDIIYVLFIQLMLLSTLINLKTLVLKMATKNIVSFESLGRTFKIICNFLNILNESNELSAILDLIKLSRLKSY